MQPNLTSNYSLKCILIILGTTASLSSAQNRKETLDICSNKGDPLSKLYCNCTKTVASCDFSKLNDKDDKKTEITVTFHSLSAPVKKLCICGSGKNVLLNLTRNATIGIDNFVGSIHRVDLFNIKGPLLIQGALGPPFGGDFYAMNVSDLHSLRRLGFARGRDLVMEDVQDLACCSQIKVPQHHAKPTFYLNNVRIGKIYSRGINSFHVWKTVILKYVTVKSVSTRGISLDSTNDRVNISMVQCEFGSVAEEGIFLSGFQNALISKVLIDKMSNATALVAISDIQNSSLVLVDNWFRNPIILNFDAHRVLNWFNMYSYWDNWTLSYNYHPLFLDSVYSVEYNSVFHISMREEDLKFLDSNLTLLSHKEVVFHENVLGNCSCSNIYELALPETLKAHMSRCDTSESETEEEHTSASSCLADLHEAKKQCKDASSKISDICAKNSIKKPSFSQDSFKTMAFKAMGLKTIGSSFLAEMMKDLKFNFHIHSIFPHSEEEEEERYTFTKWFKGSSGTTGLTVFFLLLSSLIILTGLAIFLKKRKGRSLHTLVAGDSLSTSYDELTSAI